MTRTLKWIKFESIMISIFEADRIVMPKNEEINIQIHSQNRAHASVAL